MMKDRSNLALALDSEGKFEQAKPIWQELFEENTEYLELCLKNLIEKQAQYCADKQTQCRRSMEFHYVATAVLEKYGKKLGPYKYYYRAATYNYVADYLVNIDLAECAIDCYFRALIFQDNYAMKDGGKEMLHTLSGILRCYDEVGDRELLGIMKDELTSKMDAAEESYRKEYLRILEPLLKKYNL